MDRPFFEPWIGENYENGGLYGKKILHTIIKSSGILRLTLEELIDREIYIRMINQDLVVGETFNPVMGWSKKEYEKRKKELNKNK